MHAKQQAKPQQANSPKIQASGAAKRFLSDQLLVDPKRLPQSQVMTNEMFGQHITMKFRPQNAWPQALQPYVHHAYNVTPCAFEQDEEGEWEVYNLTHSFKPAWDARDQEYPEELLGERRLINLHGVSQ